MPKLIAGLDIPAWSSRRFIRPALNDAVFQVPRIPLYHYTTQAGLLGIIPGKEIWATHNQYLNDSREFLHAMDIFRGELESLEGVCRVPKRLDCFRLLKGGMAFSLSAVNVCVSSFSEDRDSLSQWRAYGGQAGFALGFPGDFLAAVAKSEQFSLAPCVYDPSQQRLLARALLEEVVDEMLLLAAGGPQDEAPFPFGNLLPYILRFAPLLKDESFAEEREWRVITGPLPCSDPRFDYRAGGSRIVPYYRVALANDGNPFRLAEVVVGPTPQRAQALASVGTFLVKHGLGETVVHGSKVPFRSW